MLNMTGMSHRQEVKSVRRSQPPEFFGAVTVGERGQVVIPLAVRDKMGIRPGDKLLVLGKSEGSPGVLLLKAEAITHFLADATARLAQLEAMLRTKPSDVGDDDEGH